MKCQSRVEAPNNDVSVGDGESNEIIPVGVNKIPSLSSGPHSLDNTLINSSIQETIPDAEIETADLLDDSRNEHYGSCVDSDDSSLPFDNVHNDPDYVAPIDVVLPETRPHQINQCIIRPVHGQWE